MSRKHCEDIREDVSAFIDEALSAERHALVAAHVASCPECGALADDFRAIGRTLREVAHVPAPVGLADRISARLAHEEATTPAASFGGQRARMWSSMRTEFLARAAVLLLVACVSAAAGWIMARTADERGQMERDVVAAHVRSLLQQSPIQVASSDSHTVKPWFSGRLDFAPVVPDLGQNGFPLQGGRLDYIAERRIASVVYLRRQHVINLFMWPAQRPDASSRPQVSSFKGYNAVTWTAGGIVYWAVSDLNAAELQEFQSLI